MDKFSSKMGAVAAAAGSAVGLGNVWRFPYVAGEDGGAAFLLLYVLCVVCISIPVLICEFVLGRSTGRPVTSAFAALGAGRRWQAVGFCGMLTAFLILSYYNIVSGWTLYYSVHSVAGGLSGLGEADVSRVFDSLRGSPAESIVWMSLMLFGTAWIVSRGVSGGIERYGKVLMPLLFLLIVVMLVRSLTLDGAMRGLSFYLHPDFGKLDGRAVFDALGQSFFSLSIGMGTMTTYGSYIRREADLAGVAWRVAGIDFLVAFLAGAVIFPCVFAFGVNPAQGPGLVFVTLPNIFNQMPFGSLFAFAFFALLVVAALTSSVSLLEVVVAYLTDSFGLPRRRATVVAAALTMLCGVACALFAGVFDLFDNLTANVLMPLGALFIVVFVTWKLPKSHFIDECRACGTPFKFAEVCFALLKWVIPVAIAVIFCGGMADWIGRAG